MLQFTFPESPDEFVAFLRSEIDKDPDLGILKRSSRSLQVHSTDHFGMPSVIERYKYYINISWKPVQNGTAVYVKSRANATYSIAAFVVPLFSLPFFIVVLADRNMLTNDKILSVMVYSIPMVLWILWMLVIARRKKRSGEEQLRQILAGVGASVAVGTSD